MSWRKPLLLADARWCRTITNALSDSELEEASDAVEVGVNPCNLGERLCIDCALQGNAYEASSEHLCTRVARVPSKGIEPREVVLIDPKRDHAGLRLPCLVPLHLAAFFSSSRSSFGTTAKIKPESSIARLSANSDGPCST